LQSDNLLLLAATTILMLTARRRYFQSKALRKPGPQLANPAVAGSGNFACEISQSGRGRHSGIPLQIP
jgi:hypothetical protein